MKEEPDCAAAPPPPASWRCLWSDCDAPEFLSQRGLVDHVNESHMEVKKGYDELPCLWKVSESGFTITDEPPISTETRFSSIPSKVVDFWSEATPSNSDRYGCVAGLPQEAHAFQRQVQTADAHEGAHQGEAVSVRGKPQTHYITYYNTLMSEKFGPLTADPWWCHPSQL